MTTAQTHRNQDGQRLTDVTRQGAGEHAGAKFNAGDEQRYHRILETMEEAYFETNQEGKLTFFSNSFCELIGRQRDGIENKALTACLTQDAPEHLVSAFNAVLKTGIPSSAIEFILSAKNGEQAVGEISFRPLQDATGRSSGIYGTARNISQRKRLQKALAESEERYLNIVDSAPYSITIARASDGRYVQVNKMFSDYTGFSAEEVIGHTSKELGIYVNEGDDQLISNLILKDKKIDYLELRFRSKHGRILETAYSARTIRLHGKIHVLSIATDITPVKEAQNALKESEARYRAILETAPDPICLTRLKDGKYVAANRAFYQRTGYTSDEVIGRTVDDLQIYADPNERQKLINTLKKNKKIEGMEMSVRFRDGTISRDLWSGSTLEFDGEPHVVVVAKDINSLLSAQKALEEREARYRTILETAPYSIVITRRSDSKYVQVNEAFCRRTGYTREETIGRTPFELKLYDNPADRYRMMEILRQKGQVDGLEVRFRNKDGAILESVISCSPIQYGGEDCLLTITLDIGMLREYQKALKESEETYRTIMELAPFAISVTRLSDTRYLQINEAFSRLTGFSREETIGRTPDDLDFMIEPTMKEKMDETLRRDGRVDGMEVQARCKGGTIVDSLVSLTPITLSGENCLLAMTVDISELKKAQSALFQSEQKYRNILDSIEEGYWEVDLQGNFTFVNEAEARIHRCSPQKLIGRGNRSFSPPETAKELFSIFNRVYKTGVPAKVFDHEIMREDGETAFIEVSASLLKDAMGQPIGFFGVSRDVTEKKKAEKELEKYRHQLEEMVAQRTQALETAQKELVRQEKLAVLGQLTATVSHELRNPLSVIRFSNFYLQRKVTQRDDKIDKHFRRIEEQVALCDTIVADLLEYTRGRNVSVTVADLNPWIETLLNQIGETESIPIEQDLSARLPAVAHDQEKMRRVIINLVDNALLAVKDKQNSLQEAPTDFRPLVRVSTTQENNHVVLQVEDNGIGMTTETLRHALEPLFTTRARGTGIGLANVKKIVSEHNGSITLTSEPGKGTTVTIKLSCPLKKE